MKPTPPPPEDSQEKMSHPSDTPTTTQPRKVSRKDIDWQNNSEEYWRKLAGPLVMQMAEEYVRDHPETSLTEALRNLMYYL